MKSAIFRNEGAGRYYPEKSRNEKGSLPLRFFGKDADQALVLMVCLFMIVGMAVRLRRVLVIVRMLSLFAVMLVMFILAVEMIVLHRAMLMRFFFHRILLSGVGRMGVEPAFGAGLLPE